MILKLKFTELETEVYNVRIVGLFVACAHNVSTSMSISAELTLWGSQNAIIVTSLGLLVLHCYISSMGCFVIWPGSEGIPDGGSRGPLNRGLPDMNWIRQGVKGWASALCHLSRRRHSLRQIKEALASTGGRRHSL